jgi:transcriptional regulator of acetoin/glycerol metabolism
LLPCNCGYSSCPVLQFPGALFFADSAGLPRPSIDRSKPLKAASFSLYFDDHPFYTLSSLPFGNSYRLEYVLSFHAGLLAMSARDQIFDLKQRISAAVIGQEAVVDQLLIALLANGQLLMEGLPGLAKTRTIKTLARNLESEFRRIQFTPDLLPSDITGTEIYTGEGAGGTFQFQPGPVFGNLILADEINRAPAKAQAALLEAMEERQVTVAGKTHPLPDLFLVLATQNPIE